MMDWRLKSNYMLFIENQNRNCIFTVGSNCRIKLDKGTSMHKIYITYPSSSSEELARYSSYDKAEQAYADLRRYLTTDTQFRPGSFTMPEDNN